jgi:hypothetical protein
MKVISKTATGLLLDATADEIANLLSFYYRGDRVCPRIEPGLEINFAGMFEQLYKLAKQKKKLEETLTQLEAIAGLLRVSDPIVRNAGTDADPCNCDVEQWGRHADSCKQGQK